MDPCTKAYVAREFADQIQLSTQRLTTRDHITDYHLDRLAELRVKRIRQQAHDAAGIWNRRNPADAQPPETLEPEFAALMARYLALASEAELAADRQAAASLDIG